MYLDFHILTDPNANSSGMCWSFASFAEPMWIIEVEQATRLFCLYLTQVLPEEDSPTQWGLLNLLQLHTPEIEERRCR